MLSLTVVSIPTVAQAAPACTTANFVTTCVGATTDTAPYMMMVPANFNGTVYLYSHGYRPNVPVPAGIPGYGGYTVTNTPEPAPGGNATIIGTLLGKGYAVMGSGFARQGWNADSAIKTNVELIGLFKKQFTKTTKVVAWGHSLGGFITQALAEKHPDLVSAAAPLCMASDIGPLMTMAGDALWGIKTFFDPTIKGGDYKSILEVYGDIGKVLTVAGSLSAAFKANPLAPAWPATSAAPAAIKAIPSRSALVLVAAMAGVPTQSYSFDGVTGPGAPSSRDAISFASALSPAFGALENIAEAAILAIIATYDIEQQVGGAIYDNSSTDYAAQLGDGLFEYSSALSGLDATQGMLAYLAAFPRAKASSAALGKLGTLMTHKGNVNVPTIGVAGVSDNITPVGNLQWLVDRAAKKKSKNLLALWQKTPDAYTKFDASGVVSQRGVNGTGHCTATTDQILTIAKLLDSSARKGQLVSAKTVKAATANAGGLSYNPGFSTALLKYYQK